MTYDDIIRQVEDLKREPAYADALATLFGETSLGRSVFLLACDNAQRPDLSNRAVLLESEKDDHEYELSQFFERRICRAVY